MAPRKLILATAAALLASGLGACSRSGNDEPAAVDNQAMEAPETSDTPAPVATETPDQPSVAPAQTAPETSDVNTSAEAPPEAAPAPDAQMMDNASATGMTSRATRGEQTSNDTDADQRDN